jgi:arylsulfatase A-like enzyme
VSSFYTGFDGFMCGSPAPGIHHLLLALQENQALSVIRPAQKLRKPHIPVSERFMQRKVISRRTLLKTATAAAIVQAMPGRGETLRPERPNIVVILADDLGYGDLSSYGASDIKSPNIDALVAGGMRFNNFYANSPVCSPTRASILSGKYPDLVGVPGLVRSRPSNNWGYLSKEAVLVPAMLKPAGYHSAIIGKWNLGLESPNTPLDRGFDFFHGFLGDMMDDYYTHLRQGANDMRRNNEVINPQGHATSLFTDWAIDYLNEQKQDKRKFFLYLAYNAPHLPIQPPEEWLKKVREREPHLDEKRAKMVALIEHLDMSVGRVVERLKANGQFENTLIVFVSDNGGDLAAGASCGSLRGGKGDMNEGGIRVPMCALWSNHIVPGSTSNEPVLTMDIVPTICQVAGVQPPQNLDSTSILPILRGTTERLSARDLIWVRREGGPRYQGRDYYALRRGDWKILQNTSFEPFRLYNLKDDYGEVVDLASREPKIYHDLINTLMLHLQQAGRVPWERPA